MLDERQEGSQPNPQPETPPRSSGSHSHHGRDGEYSSGFSPQAIVTGDEPEIDAAPRRRATIVIVNREDDEDRDRRPEGDAQPLRGFDEEPRGGGDPQGPRPARERRTRSSSTSASSRKGSSPLEEFADADAVKVGDEIDVFLEKMENQDGLVVLSKQRADFVKVWDRVKEAAEKGEVVEGRLVAQDQGRRRRRSLRRRGLPAGQPDRAAPAAVDRDRSWTRPSSSRSSS